MWKQVVQIRIFRRIVIEPGLLAFFVGVCVGCTVTRDEVVGAYQLQYEFGTERLVLGADGTYEQFFEMDGAPKEVNKGRWELRGNGDQTVVLHNPMLVADPFGKARPAPLREPGVALLRVKKWLGTVLLILNESQGLRFERRT